MPCDFLRFDREGTELHHAPREDRVARSLINRKALAGDRARIDRGAPVDDDAIDRHAPAGLHYHLVADDHVRGERAHFDAIAQHPTPVGEQLRELAERVLRARKGVRFEALADETDEHDFRGDDRLFEDDGREARDGEREVGSDAPFKERFERRVQGTRSADDGRDERITEAEQLAIPRVRFDALTLQPRRDEGPQVGREQPADEGRERVQRERLFAVERVVNGADLAVHGAMVCSTPRINLRAPCSSRNLRI